MKKWFAGGIIVVLALIAWGGTYYYENNRDSGLTLYGNVDIRTVDVSFRVAGRLKSLNVDEGDKVTQGQLLGEIDPAPYQNSVNQIKATVEAADAQYELANEGYRSEEIAQAVAAVEQARAAYQYADSYYQRQSGLWNRKLISANDLENARSAKQQAEASLKAAKDKLAQYKSGNRPQEIMQAKANLALTQAQLAQAELNLNDTKLISPADGVILTRAVEPGTMLGAGTTVLTVSLVKPVWVRAYVDEQHLNQVKPGAKVVIHHDGDPQKAYHGHIGFVSPNAEFTPKTVQTPDLRTDLVYRLRIIVEDPDDQLRQGMPVTVELAKGDNNAN